VKVTAMDKGVSSFRIARIYPLNPNIFKKGDFIFMNKYFYSCDLRQPSGE
jgi:hypothetical protein